MSSVAPEKVIMRLRPKQIACRCQKKVAGSPTDKSLFVRMCLKHQGMDLDSRPMHREDDSLLQSAQKDLS